MYIYIYILGKKKKKRRSHLAEFTEHIELILTKRYKKSIAISVVQAPIRGYQNRHALPTPLHSTFLVERECR